MCNPTPQATDLVKALNNWALIDMTLPPAAVTGCTAPSLPRDKKALWSLLSEKHRDFFNEVTERGSIDLGQTVHHNTASYDPTETCGYSLPPDHPTTAKAKAAAKDFFLGHPVDVIEGHGSDQGAYEFEFDFVIALDTKNGLIFSFVWNLAD